jgi:hypothetical protein
MPDDWEEAVGYNKDVANNNTVLTRQTAASFFPAGSPAGYTQLEEYLHFKAVPHGTVGQEHRRLAVLHRHRPAEIHLRLHRLPVFTTSNITGGTITQSGPGNAIVRFTPTPTPPGAPVSSSPSPTPPATPGPSNAACSSPPKPNPARSPGSAMAPPTTGTATTANFTSNLGPTAFANGDAVTIDDSGSNSPTIKVTGTLTPSLTVSNSTKNFTIQGTGSLAATGGFIKSGTGTFTISNTGPNTFTPPRSKAARFSSPLPTHSAARPSPSPRAPSPFQPIHPTPS